MRAPHSHKSMGGAGEPETAFGAIAPYYDVLMRDIPYARWLEYVLTLVGRHRGPGFLCAGSHVLDLACGTGTFALLLAERGMHVTGADISAEMIAEARRNATHKDIDVQFLVQDAAALSVGECRFDLCVSLFDSLNYIVTPQRLASAFCGVRRALSARGIFIFDLNTPFALQSRMFDQRDLSPGQPVRYLWESSFDEPSRLCTVQMDFWVGDAPAGTHHFCETHVQRAYDDEEVRGYLREAGFGAVTAYQAYTLSPPGPRSDRVFYVAEVDERSA